jgi:hypothetical protein
MKNIVTKEMIGLLFKPKDGDDIVIIYGVLNYAFCKTSIGHSEATENWAKEKGDNFLLVRFKSIVNNKDKSIPLESFFEHYELYTQKFDNTKWIS